MFFSQKKYLLEKINKFITLRTGTLSSGDYSVLRERRDFIKNVAAGAVGLTFGLHDKRSYAVAPNSPEESSRVSLSTGNDRRDMIVQAMKPFEEEIKQGIQGKQIIIKPNFVYHGVSLAVTHPDAVRGVLDFLTTLTNQTIIVGEGTTSPKGTMYIFEDEGYSHLSGEYNVQLKDLNHDTVSTLWITDDKRHPLQINVINTYLDPNNYIISAARMKTHDCVLATLTLKNVIMGSPINYYDSRGNERPKMHQGGVTGINYNMYHIAHRVYPQFSIIDGVVGMEGNGPVGGTPVEHGVVLAGSDAVAVDRIGYELMGIDYNDVGYLQWCAAAGLGQGDREKINIIGPDPFSHVIHYKLHENADNQLEWKEGSLKDPRW
ncbi:DUF362 domain-containing protein [Candidatus Latescibacterota bacterium]